MKKLFKGILSLCMVASMLVTVGAKESNQSYYYISIGDSVAAGYGLQGVNNEFVSHTDSNYKNDSTNTYPHIVAQSIVDALGLDGNLYDHYANISTVSIRCNDAIGYLQDENYVAPLLTNYYGVDQEDAKYHTLYVEEIAKANLISINVGNTDVMTTVNTLLGKVALESRNNQTSYNGSVVYKNSKNPILATIYSIANTISLDSAVDQNKVVAEFKNAINYYCSEQPTTSLTYENMMEALDYIQSDELANAVSKSMQSYNENYPTLINEIIGINPDAQLYIMSNYTAYSQSLKVNGVEYTKDTLITELKNAINKAKDEGGLTSEAIQEIMEEYAYGLVYLFYADALDAGVVEMNNFLSSYAKENNYSYVDIYHMPIEDNLNPHPDLNGHQYIANQLYQAIKANNQFEIVLPFEDVQKGRWYYEYVKGVYQLGLMTGTSQTTFKPSNNITRGQLATILWRMAGEQSVENTNSFKDVASGKFYTTAIAWCKEAGVVKGKSDGTFRPANNITRQELAIMLRNYVAYCGKDVKANLATLDTYPDASTVSNYAKESMAWAVEKGLISGDKGNLNPKNTATRAQSAKMILAAYTIIEG